MVLRLVKIGNSKDIRSLKRIIEQLNFTDKIEAEIKKDGLLLNKKTMPRTGWKSQILKEIKKNGCPEMLIPDNIQTELNVSSG